MSVESLTEVADSWDTTEWVDSLLEKTWPQIHAILDNDLEDAGLHTHAFLALRCVAFNLSSMDGQVANFSLQLLGAILLPDQSSAAAGIGWLDRMVFLGKLCSAACFAIAAGIRTWLNGTQTNPTHRRDLIHLVLIYSSVTSGFLVTRLHRLVLNAIRDLARLHWEKTVDVLKHGDLPGVSDFVSYSRFHFFMLAAELIEELQESLYGQVWEHLAETTSFWLERLGAPRFEQDEGWSVAMRQLGWAQRGSLYNGSGDAKLFVSRLERCRQQPETDGNLMEWTTPASPKTREQQLCLTDPDSLTAKRLDDEGPDDEGLDDEGLDDEGPDAKRVAFHRLLDLASDIYLSEIGAENVRRTDKGLEFSFRI